MLEKDEKKLLGWLVEKELKEFEKDEEEIRPVVPQFLAIEENYEEFLKKLKDKLDKM